MAVLAPANPLDPITVLPRGTALLHQPSTPIVSPLVPSVLSAPAFSQLINPTTGHTV